MAFPRASWNVHGEQSTGALHESRWPYTHCWSCILNLLTTPLFSVFPVPLSTHFSALFSLDFWDHKKQIVPMCPFLLGLGWRWNTWVALFSKGVLGWPSRCHPCLGWPSPVQRWTVAFYSWTWKLLDTLQVSVCLVYSPILAVGTRFRDLVFFQNLP